MLLTYNYLITHCFTVFHICRTIRRHFSLRQVKLYIGQRKYKHKFTTQGRKEWPTDRPSDWIRARSLNSYFAFCTIVVKTETKEMKIRFCYNNIMVSTLRWEAILANR